MTSPNEEAIIRCETTKGVITMKMHRAWSPNGYDRAVELYERHFFEFSHFFRAVPKFLVQFGISYSEDKDLQKFAKTPIKDDPKQDIPFHRGTMSFAGSGPNSRTSEMFISYGAAKQLGREKWETPFGEVIEGMDAVDKFYSYGDMPPWGSGPEQGKIHDGPQYIENNFPLIDKFINCKVERLNGGEGDPGRVIHKGDGTDEEAFHAAREKAQNQEAPRRPHTLDQPGWPAEFDRFMNLGSLCVLGVLFLLLVIMKGRKKEEGKTN